jgi:GT2 family glycosyltransferase
MLFSILIPVRNDPEHLAACLLALRGQDASDCEVLVADDGSEPPVAAEQLPQVGARFQVVRLAPRGPAAARNVLADRATGEYLFFLDADTQPHPGMLQRARRVIADDPAIQSFFGSYDDAPAWPSLVSVYRNLLHHHVHQRSAGQEVSTFWCGCGVIRRSTYLECGGMSESFRTPAIEDVAFGMRLHDRGIPTRIIGDLQVKHLKRWTFRGWLHTDLFRRGIPWVRLMRARGEWVGQLNFSASQRIAAACALAAAALLIAAIWQPAAAILAAGPLGLFVHLNRDLFGLIARKRGIGSAAVAVPLHALYALICVASVAIGFCCPPLALAYRGAATGLPGAADVHEDHLSAEARAVTTANDSALRGLL